MDYKQIEPSLVGRWDEILEMYGISIPKWRGKNTINGPCPCCTDPRNHDRAHWRETDGRLSLYCRHCTDPTMKSPEQVIMECCNVSFPELTNDLANFIGHQDERQVKQAQIKAQSKPKRNMPNDHKQDHDKSMAFLSGLELVPKHEVFNRFSVQYPYDIYAKDNAVYFPVVNESNVVVNVFSVRYDKEVDTIKTKHLAGGYSYAAWHVIPKCEVRQSKGITWTVSVIEAIKQHWLTGKECRACLDVYNMIYMINNGVIGEQDDIIVSSIERELLPIIDGI